MLLQGMAMENPPPRLMRFILWIKAKKASKDASVG
jgi:hypothetical protein